MLHLHIELNLKFCGNNSVSFRVVGSILLRNRGKLFLHGNKNLTIQIDTVVDNATEKDIDEAREYIKKFKEKLKKYRSSGLKKEGEYSYENLVFKYLRRSDYLEKLFNLENNLLDKELSLMEQNIDFLLNLKKS